MTHTIYIVIRYIINSFKKIYNKLNEINKSHLLYNKLNEYDSKGFINLISVVYNKWPMLDKLVWINMNEINFNKSHLLYDKLNEYDSKGFI